MDVTVLTDQRQKLKKMEKLEKVSRFCERTKKLLVHAEDS